MPVNARGSRSKTRFLSSACALALVVLAACEDGLRSESPAVTSALDGSWSFTFASTTAVGLGGAPCLAGTGQVAVENGRIVGATFAELAGALRAMGALEGRVLEDEGGVMMSIATSQGGRNAFVAQGTETADGFSGTWEDIHECGGTFTAVREGAVGS